MSQVESGDTTMLRRPTDPGRGALITRRNLLHLGGDTYRPLAAVCWAELPLPGSGGWWKLDIDLNTTGAPIGITVVMSRSGDNPPAVVPMPPVIDHLSTIFSIPSDAVDLRLELRPPLGVFRVNSIDVHSRATILAASTLLWSVVRGRWQHPLAVRRRGLIRAASSGGAGRFRRFRQYLWEAYRDRQAPCPTAPSTVTYRDWMAAWERNESSGSAPAPPVVTLICPVTAARRGLLEHTLRSFRAQHDGGWQAIFIVPSATVEHATTITRCDTRSRVVECRDVAWGTLVGAGIAEARTPFVAVIEAGDELHPWAIHELRQTISANPEARVIVCDEDEIGADGRRRNPWMKTAWDPERVRCADAVGRCVFVQGQDLLKAIDTLECASPTDARALAAIVGAKAARPAHIPFVALHARRFLNPDPPPDPSARSKWGTDMGIASYRPSHSPAHLIAVPDRASDPPTTSVIIPTRDRVDLLRTAVEGILIRTRHRAEVIIVDNGSRDPATINYLVDIGHNPAVTVIRSAGPFNFSRLNNLGAQVASGEVLVLLNNDIEVIEGSWLSVLAAHAVRPGVGAVGAKLLYPNGTIQHGGVWLGHGGIAGHIDVGRERHDLVGHGRLLDLRTLSAVTAACLAVRRNLYLEVGGLNEEFQVAFNDVDFCLRLSELGHRNIWVPNVVLYHHESLSRGSDNTPEKLRLIRHEQRLMVDKWGGTLAFDPYHHPAHSLGVSAGIAAFPRSALPWYTVGEPAERDWLEAVEYP